MDYFFRFEQPWLMVVSLCVVAAAIIYRWKWYKSPVFTYSLGSQIIADKKGSTHPYKIIINTLCGACFIVLALLTGKPQIVDSRSNIIVDGIDIMLALDASGSMQLNDYSDDDRSRFDIAKQEAIRFIRKRPNDAIGLVLFGGIALSRCPITMDKTIITDILEDLSLGDIDADGPMLATGLLTAVNRLKSSPARSKVIILLTDGEPSHNDIQPEVAMDIAKQFGIKIYTIGIGSEQEGIIYGAWGIPMRKPKVNSALLKEIARQTGGRFFMAQNDRDMRSVYETIDQLERTKHESPLYFRYYDIYAWFALAVILVLLCVQLLRATIWFSI